MAMGPEINPKLEDETSLSALFERVWTVLKRWLIACNQLAQRATFRIHERIQTSAERSPLTLASRANTPGATPADESAPASLAAHVSTRLARRVSPRIHVLTPTVTVLVGLVAMTGLAAAQSGSGGLCGTPAIDLFEWAAQTGAGVLFLGGLLFGGFKHARAGLSRNPERSSEHRRTGTMAMVSGPIFGLVILLGEQAAGAAGFNAAQCAQLTPWF